MLTERSAVPIDSVDRPLSGGAIVASGRAVVMGAVRPGLLERAPRLEPRNFDRREPTFDTREPTNGQSSEPSAKFRF